ncbi:hypothetical protein Q1695_000244 [Nippostrongylus brasiliensis]|nr:hypothetical protein Q1695_000244 [Nippostrongylus brasiliensis]
MDENRQQWIDIQCETFTNWINQQIESPKISNLSRDLSNGVALIRLIEALQGRKYYGKVYDDDPTEIQMLLNVQMALDALREDGIRTVNIGSHDVVEGNTKLILGLIWCLIQRYQIASHSKIPPKKLVMAWIQSVLPELKITNFRTNWNDGRALSALLEYCQPGLCPEWKGLNPEQGLENCERALRLASEYLNIPTIISAVHLNSPHLDEFSCITYLSYFTMRGGCGYQGTLRRVQALLPDSQVEGFETTWCDGYLLALLVEAVGGPAVDLDQMRFDTFEECVQNVSLALEAASDIGVGSLVGAEDIADPKGEHLGIMALAAALCSVSPQPVFPTTQCFTHQQVNLDLAFADGEEVRVDELGVRVIGPSGHPISADSVKLFKSRTSSGAVLSIVPKHPGYHQVRIYCQGVELPSSPISLNVLSPEESRAASRAYSSASRDEVEANSDDDAEQKSDSGGSDVDISHKSFAKRRLHIIKQLQNQNNATAKKKTESQPNQKDRSEKVSSANGKAVVLEASAHDEMTLRPSDIGLVSFSGLSEPCSVGSIVEVVINAHGDCAAGSVHVDAVSPSGRAQPCSVSKRANSYTASFTPQQVGLWKIGILYDGEHIRGSPFSCQVFDAGLVQVYGLDVGLVGQELKFNVNATEAGRGHLEVSVLRHGRHIPSTVEEEDSPQVYRVNFVPDGAGQYKIHVLFNRMEVKGSPFILDIADASAVSVFGEQLRGASLGRPASFMIHAAAAAPNDITVDITAPSGKRRHGVVTALDDVSYKVEWIPQEAGEHSIDVRVFDQSVQDSPYACNIGAPEKVAVRAVPRRILTKDLHTEHSFEIDASTAGSGNLEIMINGGRVPCRVREMVSRQYKAVFTPTQSITHTIEMRFNGEEVAGSPWHIPVEDRPERRQDSNRTTSYYSELSGAGLVRAPVGKVASFEITGDGLELNDIQAKIFGPDQREFPVRILPRGNGRYTAEYRIEQVGEHHLTVWIAGRKVDGSPLSVAGYSADRVRLEPLGGGAVGHPVQFVVDAVDAGKGQLEISVNQGRVPNNVQMQGAGRCLVTFIPQHPGTYVIDVTFNGEQVHGCPIKVEILPKQVGEVIQANLTPTAVTTAISAGGSNISGAFRQPRTPTSPGLLHHSRQRSAEANPRSPTLLQEARGRTEKPWMQTYAPTSSRLSSSLSPNRQWSATSTYDRVYTADRTLSPSDPTRSKIFTETTVTHRTPSPSVTKTTYEQTNYRRRSPSPSGVRTREFAQRQARTPSPSQYERKYTGPFISSVRQADKAPYRSASPISRDEIRSRASDRVVSPYRNTPSPGERVRRVEQIDPIAAEEERERRRAQAERERIAASSVGYTVAQYGQPGNVTIDRSYSPDRYSTPRSYTDTLEKKEARNGISPSTFETKLRSESPEYSAVYERFERKRDEPPPAPAHAQPESQRSRTSPPRPEISHDRQRSRSPPPDYDTGPSLSQSIATSVKTYDEPLYSETTAITRTSYTISPKPAEKEAEIKPEVAPHRAATVVSDKGKFKVKDDQSFLRTQSELIERTDPASPHLQRSDEKTKVYDMPAENLKKTSDLVSLPLADEAQRTMEYLRVRAEDDKILREHGYGKRSSHDPSIELQEPASDIRDDVVEMAGSKDDLRDRPVDVADAPVQALEPVAELPHSPAPSAKSTPHATPKTSMKFKKEGKETKPFEFGKSKFTSKHEVVRRGKDVEVKLENLKLSKEDTLRVVVLPPMRNQLVASGATQPEVETKVKKSGSKYEISFKPTEVGTHKVFAYVNEIQHPLSPFPIRVYDSSEIIVGEIPARSNLNDTVEFTVDAGRAGFGNLEMAIKDADGIIIPSHVAQLESGTAKFLVTFTPTSKGQHTVNITFNKEVLKNSPFEVLITDPPPPLNDSIDGTASPSLSKKDAKKEKEDKKKEEKERVKREKEERAATLKRDRKSKHKNVSKTSVTKIPSLSRVGQPSSIIVEVAGHDQLEIIITDNKKNQIGTELIEIEPGVMQVNFTPQVVGDHDIEVKYGGVPVTAIPFTCRAYDPTKIKVGAIPKGLLDKPVYFTVDASEAGVGNLEVAVNEGRVPSMAHALGQHRYDISFVPKENADHTITIRFNNEPVPGSPFTCQLVSAAQASASGTGLERVPVDELTEIKIQTSATDTQPEVRVRDPQGNDLPVEITRSRQDETLCIATYTPKCVGNHQVDISMMGEPIAGSPFTAKAYDARMARLSQCDQQAVVGKPCTFAIDATRAGAGNLEIIVSVDNRNVPNFVQAEGQAKFKVSFTPQEAKEHVISVRFNGVSVPGSPMRCTVENAPATAILAPSVSTGLTGSAPEQTSEKSTLSKDLRNAQVGQKRGFTIGNPGGRAAECNVVVIAPNGARLPVTVKTAEESFFAEFTPTLPGVHEITIYLDEKRLNEMPILVSVGAGKASFPPTCLVGKRYSFDLESASKDLVRVDIRDPHGRPLAVQIEELPDSLVRASCRFKEVGTHSIDTFVDEHPVGQRLLQRVVDPVNAAQLVSEVKREIVGERAEHKLLIVSGIENEVDVVVRDRDHCSQVVTLAKVSDTLWTASWSPKSEGVHHLAISVAGVPIAGSPFALPVLDPSAVRVIGLRDERVGVQQQFNVDYNQSGALSASVEIRRGSTSVPCSVKRVKPGLLVCSFTPSISGLYLVDVHIDGLILPECPYECHVSADGAVRACGDALRRAQRGRVARFEVSPNDAIRGELDVLVSDPNGGPLPVRCYRQQDDSYWVEFTPEQTGTHTIEVTFGDVPVAGSPFHCEVVDPKKVRVRGLNDGLHLRHVTTIDVDRRQAGEGELTVEISDPTGAPLKVQTLKSPGGEDRITFLPNQTGPHKVNVKVAGFQIPGYPQTIMVSEQPQPSVYGAAVDHSIKIDEPASLIFDPKGSNGGLKISVTGPRDNKVRHKVIRRPNGTSEVVFSPEEVGTHTVNIHFNNKPIAGSPFTVRVVDPSKVVVNDLDMDRDGSFLLRLGQQNVFDVDATAAGPGKLRAEVRNSESALLGEGPAVDDLGYGKYRVAFTPKQPGRYSIYLYWNELPVESAFPVRARSSEERATTSREAVAPLAHARDKSSSSVDDDVSRIMVRGDGLHRAQLKEPNEFIVDGSDISHEGRLTAMLLGTKADIPVRVQQLGHNVFKATYTPLTGGTYELHILWNGVHVKGSPFKVTADTSASPAELISVDNTSLKIGIINDDIKTVIDTRRAGPGQLSAQCMGPVKLAYCELYDHRDGTYTLSVRPTEVGKHTLVIKYNDQHVRGSPFLIHVSMPPDPSKVRVYGPGIEHGILSLFKSNFVVETRGAGAGQLTVRVRGPKGAFNVEMQREKKNERTIHCKYEPKEPGDYQVEVKWHGEHVPGSPFLVMIVDTEQELSRFLRGEAPSPTPATPFVPPGWVGPPPLFPPPMGQRYGPPMPMGPMGPMGPPPPPGAMIPFNAPPPPRHKAKYH